MSDCSFCVSTGSVRCCDENDALRTERDALRENIAWIQKRETELVIENDALKTRVAELEAQYDALSRRRTDAHGTQLSECRARYNEAATARLTAESALKAAQARVAEQVLTIETLNESNERLRSNCDFLGAADVGALQARVADLKFALGDNAGWFDRAMAAESALKAEQAQTLKYQTALAREEAKHAETRAQVERLRAALEREVMRPAMDRQFCTICRREVTGVMAVSLFKHAPNCVLEDARRYLSHG